MKFLEEQASVVIIDDKQDEVQGIITHCHDKGIGCKFFNADPFDGDDKPGNYMPDVVLVFLDLYYSTGPLDNGFDPSFAVNWVSSVIPPNAFYILIVWTKDPSQAEGVLEELKLCNRKPYLHFTHNKGEFAVRTGEEKYNYDGLMDAIDKQIEDVSAFEEIQIWKNTLKRTSNVVLGGLLTEDTKEFTDKLKKIICEHGGEIVLSDSHGVMNKRAVLFEALNNVVISNAPQYVAENSISEANQQGLYNMSGKEVVVIDKQLNSWFHFILKKDLDGMIFPGIIARNNSSFLNKLYSIKDDEKIEKLLKFQFGNENTVIEDIVVNITRPCDYAQNKYGKNLKLLSGLAIKNPKRKSKDNYPIEFPGKAPDSVKVFDHLFYDETCEDLTLLFDFRYCFSLPEHIFLNKFENIKMLNKELLSEIQVSYSSYVSRLGYTRIF